MQFTLNEIRLATNTTLSSHFAEDHLHRLIKKMDARRFILFCVVWWCSLNPFIYVAEGRYELQVMLRGYDNPDQKCEFCHTRCCDIKQSVPCTNNSRCDTTFFYCLRTYEARGRNCSYSGSVESLRNRNDASLDFSLPRVLGLDNPLSLEGLTDTWNVSNTIAVLYHGKQKVVV